MRLLLLSLTALACRPSAPRAAQPGVYVLIRSSVADKLAPDPTKPPMRIHVATFDAENGNTAQRDAYNASNCNTAAELFAAQPAVMVKYWCEHGPFVP